MPLRLAPWRAVESQHQVATRALVDSDAEQEVLEALIETAKPPSRAGPRLHYLLATPFRYPPLPRGSRFGGRHEPGIWYGAERIETALSEVAYYRLVFLDGTAAFLEPLQTELTLFTARVATTRGIDLTAQPFDRYTAAVSSRTSYRVSRPLGTAMREVGVEAFRYRSARDPNRGAAVGVFDPVAFRARKPVRVERWWCTASPAQVEFRTREYVARPGIAFTRRQFLVAGRLPIPAL